MSVSDDKTARVWRLSDGKLINVLRPPIGPSNSGQLICLAISPNGRTVALAGMAGSGWELNTSIYLFDLASGSMTGKLGGVPGVVWALSWSRDARFVASAVAGKSGIRVFRVSDGRLIAEDAYRDGCQGMDFDSAGRLVTCCFDGAIRLYDANFKLISTYPTGRRPFKARFSPDGSQIAVGYEGSASVSVHSSSDLSRNTQLSGVGISGGVPHIAWSADGRIVYGAYGRGSTVMVRAWSADGRGGFTDLDTETSGPVHDISRASTSLIFCTGAPACGIISPNGKTALFSKPATVDWLTPAFDSLRCDGPGTTVQYQYGRDGGNTRLLTLGAHSIVSEARQSASCSPPIVASNNIRVSAWQGSSSPKLNGSPLRFNNRDTCRALAISPNDQTFVLGSNWSLASYDRNGKIIWQNSLEGAARRVNISGDGKLALAAFGDGTIRWFRMKDGKELLAFFPHVDGKRWVLWTPSGYYDCSPGGEDLIGWHVNHGADHEAYFFPASRFRDQFYRPDIISTILVTQDEAEAVRISDATLGQKKAHVAIEKVYPPVVRILSPQDGSVPAERKVTIRFSVETPSGEAVTRVRALLDGRPLQAARQLGVANDAPATGKTTRELEVTLPDRDCKVSLLAENQFAVSEPATILLRFKGREPEIPKPKLYVLAVGVSHYATPAYNLDYPAKDAGDFVRVMQEQKGGMYRDIEVRLLTDEKATKDNILDGLEWIQKETTSRDVAMVFLSGHGQNEPTTGNYHFVPHNFSPAAFKRTGLAFSDIKTTLAAIAGKAVFFVDSCHSGGAAGSKEKASPDIVGIVNELASAENGVVVFAASTGKETALEDPKWGNGAFTKALLEGIGGAADAKLTGRVTVNMLDLYVSERVKKLTEGKQHPTTTKPPSVPDFPVALHR